MLNFSNELYVHCGVLPAFGMLTALPALLPETELPTFVLDFGSPAGAAAAAGAGAAAAVDWPCWWPDWARGRAVTVARALRRRTRSFMVKKNCGFLLGLEI
jgi:hypothetical protein